MRVRWVPTSPLTTPVTAETPASYAQECPVRLPARRCRRVHIAVVAIAVLAAVAVVTFPAIARAGAQQGAENGAATGAGDTAWFAGLSPDWDDTNVRSRAGGLSLNGDSPGPASPRPGPPQGMLLTAAHR